MKTKIPAMHCAVLVSRKIGSITKTGIAVELTNFAVVIVAATDVFDASMVAALAAGVVLLI